MLLNITDGLLGEFLKLHVICTVNCPVERLDPALLRPGRLTARHHFGRLKLEQAIKVAKFIGKTIAVNDSNKDYSLAEIFTGQLEEDRKEMKPIGFTRNTK